jgi:hypothetical protein
MDATTIVIVTVAGSLITLLLGVNAFFLKSLVSEMSGMRIDLTRVTIQHDNTVGDVKDNKTRILETERESSRMRERVHSLEGAQSQLLHFIDKFEQSSSS